MIIQTQYVLARNASYPIQGGPALSYPNGGIEKDYYWPGSAATANVADIDASKIDWRRVVAANWLLAWDPRSNGAGPTGVRLVSFRQGETGLLGVREWPYVTSEHTGPTTVSVDENSIKAYLIADLSYWGGYTYQNNTVLPDGTIVPAGTVVPPGIMYLGHRTHGNGSYGPQIYASVLNVYSEF
jgi:hypothetical protein